jgi:hypothetical protein
MKLQPPFAKQSPLFPQVCRPPWRACADEVRTGVAMSTAAPAPARFSRRFRESPFSINSSGMSTSSPNEPERPPNHTRLEGDNPHKRYFGLHCDVSFVTPETWAGPTGLSAAQSALHAGRAFCAIVDVGEPPELETLLAEVVSSLEALNANARQSRAG